MPNDFLGGNQKIPIFHRGKKETTPRERAETILDEKLKAFWVTARPSPLIDVMLFVDQSALAHPDDWKVHDKGSFKNFTRRYTLIGIGKPKKLQKKPDSVRGYTFWTHCFWKLVL